MRIPRRAGAPGALARALGRTWLRTAGWRVEGDLALPPRAVLIAAPHTSNWDLPFMLAVAYQLGIRPAWLGKAELFRAPFGTLFRRLGGIAVDRSQRGGVVEQAVAALRAAERLVLVVPPSGTRRQVSHWKSGFYHIARGAGVPIVCTFLDYRRRVGGLGAVIEPGGDVRADMDRIRAFYRGIVGRYPEHTTEPRLIEED